MKGTCHFYCFYGSHTLFLSFPHLYFFLVLSYRISSHLISSHLLFTSHLFFSPLQRCQAYFFRAKLPITDYINDTKTVLDQAPRVLNALIDIGVEMGLLDVVLALTVTAKMVIQVRLVTTVVSSSTTTPPLCIISHKHYIVCVFSVMHHSLYLILSQLVTLSCFDSRSHCHNVSEAFRESIESQRYCLIVQQIHDYVAELQHSCDTM